MKALRNFGKIITLVVILSMIVALSACSLLGGSLELKSFSVDRSTVKTTYYIGDEIDFSGIQATVTYNDASLNAVYTFANLKIEYPEDITATVGTKDVIVSFLDPNLNVTQSTKVQITVTEDPNKPKHDSYYVDTADVKTTYIIGEELSFDGIKLYEKMTVGQPIAIDDVQNLDFVYASDITATTGSKAIEVKYKGESAGVITITVKNPAITGAELSTDGVTLDYNVGDTLTKDNFAGLSVLITYENNTSSTVTDFEFADLDTLTAAYGEKTVVVSYTDPVSGTVQNARFKIRVDGVERYTMDTSAVKAAYFEGEALDFSGIVVTAKYFYAGNKPVAFEDITFIHAADLTATPGQSKEVTVKVGDEEIGKFTIAVGDIIATPSVDTTNVDLSYRVGETVSLDGLTVKITYNNGAAEKTLTLADLTVATDLGSITATAGTKQITLQYADDIVNDTVTLHVSIEVYGIYDYEIDASEMKTTYIVGDTLSTDGIKVYALYNDGGEKALVADLSTLTIESGVTAAVSASKIAKVYLGGAEIGTITFVIEKNEVTNQEITGTFDTNYETNETVNFEGLEVKITYKNGDVETLTLDKLTLSGADTSTFGSKTVTVSCLDPVNNETLTLTFTISVIEAKGTVIQFEKPGALTSFDTDNKNAGTLSYGETGFSGQFAEGGKIYVIGDDNEFKLLPKFAINQNGLPEELTQFYSTVDMYVLVNSAYEKLSFTPDPAQPTIISYYLGDTLIVKVDTYRGLYQFSDASVGKQVKISVIPSQEHYISSANAITLEARIIDGYNVYEAWQLAVLDQRLDDNVWDSFKTENGIFGYNPAGVVLHDDIKITENDVPSDFFYVTDAPVSYKNGITEELAETLPAGTKYLKDGWNIYRRTNSGDLQIQGNFFTISVKDFPLVPSPAVFGEAYADRHYGADFSNSTLFMFETLNDNQYDLDGKIENDSDKDHLIIENLSLIGNAATNSLVDTDGNLKSAGGLIFLKSSRHAQTAVNNVIGNSFFITYFPELQSTLNINDVKCYDSYQNAIFIWADGTVNVKDSYFVNVGGPIVLAQSREERNKWYNPVVNTENTVMETTLSGQEIWFNAVGATSVVSDITALGNSLQYAGLGNFTGTNGKADPAGKMNILGLLMNNAQNASGAMTAIDACGTMWFNGKGLDRQHSTDATQPSHWDYIYQASNAISGMTGQIAPFITAYNPDTQQYTTVYTDGTNLYDLNDLLLYSAGMAGAPSAISPSTHGHIWQAFMSADTVTLSQGGLSVVFEFYH